MCWQRAATAVLVSQKKDELADTGCVLAGSCDSCTRESKEENELADMGCVLAEELRQLYS